MSDPIILLLSLPPSANRLWRNNRLSPDYRKWKDTAGWEAKTQLIGVAPIKGSFSVRIEVPANRRDLDNSCKPLLDLCQAVGAIENDKHAEEIHLYRVEREGVLITLAALAS
jgi:Holliday junction resolvase RusA-like endonuclease